MRTIRRFGLWLLLLIVLLNCGGGTPTPNGVWDQSNYDEANWQ